MIILCINAGSSSLKFLLYDYTTRESLATGAVERVGDEKSFIEFSSKNVDKVEFESYCPDHEEAIKIVMDTMVDEKYKILETMDQITAVGHRVVHGGNKIKYSVVIDREVIKIFKSLYDLAPLHMPANVMGIEAARAVLPNVHHMAIMDTAWHQTMPVHAFMYALPHEWYEEYGVRRYGFHGTSHLYVSRRAAVLLGKDHKDTSVVVMHIGNGASANAIKDGKSYDTSMGLTPLEGLIMGTRSGDFDPAINYLIMQKEGRTPEEMNSIVNKKGGHYGITGKYSDRRDLLAGAEKGDRRCQLAIEMESYRVKKYIGSYMAAMGGADAIVFTAGVGEMNAVVREKALEGLEFLGIKLDKEKNKICKCRNAEFEISTADSPVKVYVIPTDEEIVFIEDVYALTNGTYKDPSEYVYEFQKPGYVNEQRKKNFKKDVEKNPKLKEIQALPPKTKK